MHDLVPIEESYWLCLEMPTIPFSRRLATEFIRRFAEHGEVAQDDSRCLREGLSNVLRLRLLRGRESEQCSPPFGGPTQRR